MPEVDLSLKKTLVLGASTNPSRYSYLAAQRLKEMGHPFVLLGRSEGEVAGEPIIQAWPEDVAFHTVTVYLSSANQGSYYELLKKLKPRRVIFNPGSENVELMAQLEDIGIEVIEACTLVMLSTKQY